MSQVTFSRAIELLSYDPETGIFRWKVRRAQMRAGSIAGHQQKFERSKSDYRVIRIDNHLHLAHRLAWLIQTGNWPTHEVDHRDLNGMNNCWSNLRPATPSENRRNCGLRSDNKSGYKGVSLDSFTGRWVARIRIPNGRYSNLGRFDTAEQAANAYAAANAKFHGDFARLI